jgi:RHS repeat-associated protein
MRCNIFHHIEYMPSGEQFSEQRDIWATPYKFNDYGGESFNKAFEEHTARSAELDQETGLYYYGARYYTPEIGIWLSVDPLSDKYPSLSPYAYCALNPVILVDPDGRDIDPDAPGYNNAKDAATPGSDSYQPAFAKLYNGWKENGSINVQFIDNMAKSQSPDAAGTVERGDVDNKGVDGAERTNYKVFWDSSNSTTEKLGTSALFEESKHLEDGLSGKFSINTGGCAGFDTMNEVEAKQWVVDNISGIKDKYDNGGFKERTHYGYFKDNPNKLTAKSLENGIGLIAPNKDASKQGKSYTLFGTGGYKK